MKLMKIYSVICFILGITQIGIAQDINSVKTKTYRIDGTLTGAQISYYDKLGKAIQIQNYDPKTKRTWVNETLYDKNGRAALQTLAAPVGYGYNFSYENAFIKKTDGTIFTLSDFDNVNVDAPATIGGFANTLGWYYSENNINERYQDITDRPYIRTIFSELNPNQPLRNIGGNKIDNEWKQTYTFTMPAGQELSQPTAFGIANYVNKEVLKTVTRDVHEIETVTFVDTDGRTLATARSGNEENTNGVARTNSVRIMEQGWVDIHIPKGGCDNIVLYDKSPVIPKGTSFENGIENLKTVIESKFANEQAKNSIEIEKEIEAIRKDIEVEPTGGIPLGYYYRIYNLITEEVIDNKSPTNAYSLLPGFYRLETRYGFIITISGNPIFLSASAIFPEEFGVQHCENYYDYSLNYYNKANQLTSSVQPLEQLQTTYLYNEVGQLKESSNPDEGVVKFKYRKDGQIRFSQSIKQYENGNQFSYTNYDEYARPVTSGVLTPRLVTSYFENLDPDNPDILALIGVNSEQQHTVYDRADTDGLQAAFEGDSRFVNYGQQSFVSGNVSKTYTTNPSTTTTWYSYDIYGRVQWVVQKINGLSGVKTIDYEYDAITSQVTKVLYQKGITTEQFLHRYTYDSADYGLVKVETSLDDISYTENASYTYYETRGLKRVNIAQGLQGIDYVYNLNGQLKSINNPNLNAENDPGGDINDLFGMNLHYYNQDYRRTNTPKPIANTSQGIDQYNGNIKAWDWNTKNENNGVTDTYYYKYNKNNWLEGASFNEGLSVDETLLENEYRNSLVTSSEIVKASQSITLQPGFHAIGGSNLTFEAKINNGGEVNGDGDYNVYGISYDANGNIQRLNRNKNVEGGNNKMDQLSYHYKTDKPNQLLRVDDAVTLETNAKDIKDQEGANYEYNSIGQLIKNNEEGIGYAYNASGLVTEVTKNNVPLVKFYYSDKGHRVRKESYNPSNGNLNYTEHYVRDASGTTMAIYRNEAVIEHTIYGSSRLGVYKRETGTSLYQLTDHLGNVRAVVGRTQTGEAIGVTSATDYYPFGMPMPNRTLSGAEEYRYAYQGQEVDPETGKEAFQLRLWDSRIGRWLTTDPYSQYHSPYLGMGNNPITMVDPDGGMACDKPGCQETSVNSLVAEGFKPLSGELGGLTGNDPYLFTSGVQNLDEVLLVGSTTSSNNNFGFYDFLDNLVWALNGGDIWANQVPEYYTLGDRPPQLIGTLGISGGAKILSNTSKAINQSTRNIINKVDDIAGSEFIDDGIRMFQQPLSRSTPLTKKSIIEGFRVSNHAFRKSGLGRGATEELVSRTINGAKQSGNIISELGTGKFAGNIIKIYRHNDVKVAVDQTRNIIMSIRPTSGFHF